MIDPGAGRPGLTAEVSSIDGWPIPHATLTVTDHTGQQVERANSDEHGTVVAPSLPPGTYTAIVTAPGFEPTAQLARVNVRGSAALGVVTLARLATAPLPPTGTWVIDPLHSSIALTAHHLGIGAIRGRFSEFGGRLRIAYPFEQSTVHAEIKAASIDTDNPMRDGTLRSRQFLAVEDHPTIEYQSGHLVPRAAGRWTVHGTLTLHGISKPVNLDLTYLGVTDDPWGGVRAGFHAVASLHRHDFAVSFNERLLSGVAQIGGTVRVELDVQAVSGTTLPWEGTAR